MRKTSVAAVAATLILSGCWTTHVALKYQAPPNLAMAPPGTAAVSVGAFADARGSKPNWIGRIRGTFGNSLEVLVVDEPVANLVQTQFRDGLQARQFPVVDGDAEFELSGVIRKLSSIQFVHLETNVEIEVQVRRLPNREPTFAHTYSAQVIETARPVDAMRALTEKTLRDVVNQALDDRAFRNALRPPAQIR